MFELACSNIGLIAIGSYYMAKTMQNLLRIIFSYFNVSSPAWCMVGSTAASKYSLTMMKYVHDVQVLCRNRILQTTEN